MKAKTILEEILIKMYHNGYTDHIAGVTAHAEAVKDQWLNEAAERLEADLLAKLPEKKHLGGECRPYHCMCLYTQRNDLIDKITNLLTEYCGGTK